MLRKKKKKNVQHIAGFEPAYSGTKGCCSTPWAILHHWPEVKRLKRTYWIILKEIILAFLRMPWASWPFYSYKATTQHSAKVQNVAWEAKRAKIHDWSKFVAIKKWLQTTMMTTTTTMTNTTSWHFKFKTQSRDFQSKDINSKFSVCYEIKKKWGGLKADWPESLRSGTTIPGSVPHLGVGKRL